MYIDALRTKNYPLEKTIGLVHCKRKRCQTCHNVCFCIYIYIYIYIHALRTKNYPLEKTIGLVHCKRKRCQTCHNVKETETFTSSTTGKTLN